MGKLLGLEIEQEITRLFQALNDQLWDGKLENVVLTFSGSKARGHFTNCRVWFDHDGPARYEINLNAYELGGDPLDVAETLLHEQVHLFCRLHGINECSNAGRYHNRRFKQVAEEHGLLCSRPSEQPWGWCKTELGEETREFVRSLNIRTLPFREAPAPRRRSLVKYACPNCRTFAYVCSKQSILCGNCKVPLVPAPPNRKRETSEKRTD